jgi:hypothetical protein
VTGPSGEEELPIDRGSPEHLERGVVDGQPLDLTVRRVDDDDGSPTSTSAATATARASGARDGVGVNADKRVRGDDEPATVGVDEAEARAGGDSRAKAIRRPSSDQRGS